MKKKQFIFMLCMIVSCSTLRNTNGENLPGWIKGRFIDDYGIEYTVNDTVFIQHPSARYYILSWNEAGQYLLVKNDESNPTEKGLYSRIDYLPFTGMEPYTWGFCLTVYNAKDTVLARMAPSADRSAPRKGCNGYPFSRMKRK